MTAHRTRSSGSGTGEPPRWWEDVVRRLREFGLSGAAAAAANAPGRPRSHRAGRPEGGAEPPAGSPRQGTPAHDVTVAEEEQWVRTTFLRLRGTADAVLAAADAGGSAATGAYHVAERDAARRTHRTGTRAQADAAQAYEQTRSVLLDRTQRLAPWLAGAPWGNAFWRSADWLGQGHARYVRVGSFHLPGAAPEGSTDDLPVLVPLLDGGNLTLVADGAVDNTWPFDTVHGVLLRTFAAVPAGRLEVVVFDPRIRGVASPFAGLRKYGNDLLGDPLATAGELTARLVQLRAAVTRVAEMAGAHGVGNLGELTDVTKVQPEPYRLLVVCDYPYGVDAAAQDELLRLVEGGPRRGVSLLVHHDPSVTPEHEVDPAALLAHSTVMRGTNAAARVNVLPDVTVRPDSGPPRALVDTVASQVAEAAWRGAAPTVDFESLIPDADHLWTENTVEGMTARIGRSGLDTASIELRGSDPALPNVLIGGASGQGKSNLLLVMLHSIAASLPPEEVAMYLLDYKDGLEFDRLGPRPGKPWGLPHAKVLGLEGDRPFGLSVLRHLDNEFRSRAELLREAGHSNLGSYRAAFPDRVLPRLLLVIDEFQMLVAEDDAVGRESIAILETLARRGRAVGVHLVLASQTLSGIETLKTKERSIFGQFPWRLSLKTESSESEAVLGPGNTEAARLRFRGEVVLNSEYGDPEHNRRAVVAYADERLLDDLREHLWKKAGGPQPPRIFYAARPSDPADLPRALTRVLATAPATDETRYALLGLPVDVDPVPVSFGLTGDPGRTLAILGEGRADAFGLFGSMVWSLAAQYTAGGAEFVVLDAAGGEAGSAETDQLVAAARSRDQQATVHTGPAVPGALLELGKLVDARLAERALGLAGQRPVYVLGVGLHRAARLTQFGDNGIAPVDGLRKLVRDGALVDVYLVGWWNSLRVFGEHLSYEHTPLVGGYAFLRTPESDVQTVLGPFVRYTPQPHRVLFCDLGHGGVPTPVVPFGLPPEGGR